MREARCGMAGGWSGRMGRAMCAGIGLALLFALASAAAGRSQARPPADIINRPPPMPTDPLATGDYDAATMERRLNALNIERQKQMVSDTNKLLKLARELNEEVAAQNTGTLTDEQLHKVAEIEKLARRVKERMAEGVVQPVPVAVPAPNVFPGH